MWNCPQVNAIRPHWWLVSIGLGNGLLPSSNNPLPEPMLTKIYDESRHKASLSQSQLTYCRIVAPYSFTGHHWFSDGLSPVCTKPVLSHYWGIVNWTLGNKTSVWFDWKCKTFCRGKYAWKCCLQMVANLSKPVGNVDSCLSWVHGHQKRHQVICSTNAFKTYHWLHLKEQTEKFKSKYKRFFNQGNAL